MALAATATAFAAARRGQPRAAAAALALAAIALHANMAAHWWLSPWDERYHALVAKHLVAHPLEPTLVERPLYERPPADWRATRVWLHKPPVALWLMAGSRALFGSSEPALRVPSVLAGGGGVLLTYAIAAPAVGTTAALLAAGFQAWSGRLALLSGGLRSTDHVDALFVFMVSLAVALGLRSARSFAAGRAGSGWRWCVATGIATGVAILTKSAPAVVALAVYATATAREGRSRGERFAAPALALALAAAVALPWLVYTARMFPEAAAWARAIPLLYWREPAGGHAGPWWFHLANLPRYHGAFAWLALIPFLAHALHARDRTLPLAVWFVATYAAFTVAATRMKAYPAIAWPVVFIALGWLVATHLARRRALGPVARLLGDAFIALAVASFVATGAIKEHGQQALAPRRSPEAEDLRQLGRDVAALGPGPWLVFGVRDPIAAMFYADATAVPADPDPASLARARAKGFRVAVRGDASEPRFAAIREEPQVVFLPPPR